MPSYKTFALDDWDSCVDPLTLAELQALNSDQPILDQNLALTYGPARGSVQLRSNIVSLYQAEQVQVENVLVTSGTISANFLVLDTVVEAGDHVIVQHPTYLQLLEIPRRAGAEVSLWRWKPNGNGSKWEMDLEELRNMIKPNTKVIVLSTPNNPLGSTLTEEELHFIVDLAAAHGILILCDEVFRFMDHDTKFEPTPSLLELGYDKSIVTGSVSKGFALPGVRLGWIAASPALKDTVLNDIAHTRDYTTIAVSQVDQQIAAFALSTTVRDNILSRSKNICEKNLKTLRDWTKRNSDWASFAEPKGGGTVVLKILGKDGTPVDDVAFADALTNEESVSVPPAGRCFGYEADGTGETDLKGYVRIGIVQKEGPLEQGLKAIERLRERWQ